MELECGLLAKLGDLCGHPHGVVRVFVLSKLFTRKYLGLWIRFKPREKEGKGRVVEKFVLRVATVLVHGLTHDSKVDEAVLKELIVFVVAMGEDEELHELDELEGRFLSQVAEQALELVVHEVLERCEHRNVLLLALPLLVEGLVLGLEVECHLTEAGPLEVEVKVLVVLLVARVSFLRRAGFFHSLLTAFYLCLDARGSRGLRKSLLRFLFALGTNLIRHHL
mmetsp:Transcript_7067/g.9843  ORF Transcript_7067/g.9843 Transcript_7067/m.9843 type:complete len:223 (-) Transcript_7067:385-1053(-)